MGILKLNDISYSGSGSAKQTAVTQAEYDALVQAGTVDPTMEYFITDGIPASVKYYHNYSTDEQVVGTWIDGSTLYEKTWSVTAPSSNTSARIVDLSGIGIDKVISQDAFISVSGNITPHGGGSFVIWYRTRNNTSTPNDCIMCTMSNSTYYEGDMVITLRYTKAST